MDGNYVASVPFRAPAFPFSLTLGMSVDTGVLAPIQATGVLPRSSIPG